MPAEKRPQSTAFSPFGELPPHDIEAEEAVLASCMVDEMSVPIACEMLVAGDFFREENGWVFDAIAGLFSRGEAVNSVTVSHALSRAGRLGEMGGASTLARMVRSLPTSLATEFYGAIVKRQAGYRGLIRAGNEIMRLAYTAPEEQDGVYDRADSLLMAARGEMRGGSRVVTASEAGWTAADDVVAFLDDPMRITGYRTGWWQLDGLLNGLARGGLCTVGAATSVGKSLFLQNIVRRFGMDGRPVLMFCTEMTPAQVIRRLAWMHAGIDPFAIRKQRKGTDEQRDAVMSALEAVRQWPLYLVGGRQTPASIRALTRVHRRLNGVEMTVVDHMGQGFVTGEGDDEKQRIGDVTSTLKTVAADEDIVVLAASHVSRLHANPPRLLQLADLYGSTHIEQDSSQVVLLTPCEITQDGNPAAISETKAKQTKTRDGGVAVWVDVAKNRDGATGGVPLYLSWHGHGGRFIQMTHSNESEAAG